MAHEITVKQTKSADAYPYSFAEVTSEADYSVKRISQVIAKLVKLAQIEKQTSMLADEIERNKRRVNALEYVMIPQLAETIKYIASKLDENEKASIMRLMKVKSMIADRNSEIAYRQRNDEDRFAYKNRHVYVHPRKNE